MDSNEKLLIILGFLVIIIFFLFYTDFSKIILSCISNKKNKNLESFNSYLFRPQQIFKNNGKIYLLDTQRVLEINTNPKIFNSYTEYRKYLISLEKTLKENLITKIGGKKIKLNEIKESTIPKLNFKLKNKKESDEVNPFYKNYVCQRQTAHCDLNKKTSPFYNSIYNPEDLKKFKEKVCDKKLLSEGQCQIIKSFQDNREKLNQICHHKNMILPENQKTFGDMCETHRIISNEDRILSKVCNDEITNLDRCLLDDYFREDLLDSLAN